MIDFGVVLRINKLVDYSNQVINGINNGTGPFMTMLERWTARYLSFIKARFVRMSRGGWASLALSTIIRRRHGMAGRYKRGSKAYARAKASGGGQVAILWDTGTLINAVDPVMRGAPGQLIEKVRGGLRIGFGGNARHPKSRGASIAQIAAYHQFGGPNLPKRPIMVDPDGPTIAGMQQDAWTALEAVAKENAIG